LNALATPKRPRRGAPPAGAGATAVLIATAAVDDGAPAAALAWEDGTVLRRLLAQLADLGVRSAHVVTRPGFEELLGASAEGLPIDVGFTPSPALADDFRAIAEIARKATGTLIVAQADIVTQREVLAGLLADPRVPTGILASGGHPGRPYTYRVRSNRGRVASVASPYHRVRKPRNSFLGVVKVAPAEVGQVAAVADELAALTGGPLPESWQAELERKSASYRMRVARIRQKEAGVEVAELDDEDDRQLVDAASVELSDADEAELRRRLTAAREDATALLLTGIVRSGMQLSHSWLRKLFWARPLSEEGVRDARERIGEYDEDAALLESAVKATDGFFTTFFVSPYSKYIARWCARRGFTPNQVTTVSLGIGVLAAAAFATGARWGQIAGAVLLQAAFTTDCVDGQLARYTRQFSKLGAWLDSIFDRSKEYLVFGGLAIGASAAGDPVWVLAAAALTLQTSRHAMDFSYGASQRTAIGAAPQRPLEEADDRLRAPVVDEPEPIPADEPAEETEPPRPPLRRRFLSFWRRMDRRPGVLWVKRVIAFPIGERFFVISLTAAIWDPRVTFTVLIAWGTFAVCYSVPGRLLRSLSR
jgi:phosphatidylglycerophosphate synthase